MVFLSLRLVSPSIFAVSTKQIPFGSDDLISTRSQMKSEFSNTRTISPTVTCSEGTWTEKGGGAEEGEKGEKGEKEEEEEERRERSDQSLMTNVSDAMGSCCSYDRLLAFSIHNNRSSISSIVSLMSKVIIHCFFRGGNCKDKQ